MTPPHGCDPFLSDPEPVASPEDWQRFREAWRAMFGPHLLKRIDDRRERLANLAARGRGEASYPPSEGADSFLFPVPPLYRERTGNRNQPEPSLPPIELLLPMLEKALTPVVQAVAQAEAKDVALLALGVVRNGSGGTRKTG